MVARWCIAAAILLIGGLAWSAMVVVQPVERAGIGWAGLVLALGGLLLPWRGQFPVRMCGAALGAATAGSSLLPISIGLPWTGTALLGCGIAVVASCVTCPTSGWRSWQRPPVPVERAGARIRLARVVGLVGAGVGLLALATPWSIWSRPMVLLSGAREVLLPAHSSGVLPVACLAGTAAVVAGAAVTSRMSGLVVRVVGALCLLAAGVWIVHRVPLSARHALAVLSLLSIVGLLAFLAVIPYRGIMTSRAGRGRYQVEAGNDSRVGSRRD